MANEKALVIPAIVEQLYAGTLDDVLWHQALLGVADLVGASGAMLFAFNPVSGAVIRDENHRVDPQIVADYARYWTFHDIRRMAFTDVPVGVIVTEATLDLPHLKKTSFFNEFLLPADAPHFMPAWLRKTPDKAVAISLLGSRQRGNFVRSEVHTFEQILPHVARALEIRDRLEASRVRADVLAHSLESFSFGIMVLDAQGRLLEANSIAEEYLRTNDGLSRAGDGSLRLRDPADAKLRYAIASRQPPAQTQGLISVPRLGAQPISLLLAPLVRPQTAWLSRDPRWLVLVFDPVRQIHVSTDVLRQDLDITPREAEVAARLFAGSSPREVAQQLGVSPETVRTQLKAIFRKTGAPSQAELMRRIALGPAVCKSGF